jgi:hypothetical protein
MAVFYHIGLIEWLKVVGLAGKGMGIHSLIWTHAHLALIGFVTLTIMGAMYHLVPMLVWMEKYGPKMGKEKVPNIQDLFSQKVASLILITMVLGIGGIYLGSIYSVTILLRWSAFLIAITGSLFTVVMYRILF